MTWLPNPIVTIGGVAYTSETLWDVSINYGRTTVWEQARASYAQINILNLSNVAVAFLINDTVTITLEDSVGANTTVFTGFVTGIENKITQSGDVAKVLTHQVSAVGSFAFMARKVVGTSAYPKEYDDDRINRIFTEAGVSVGVVDPPVYEFTARAATVLVEENIEFDLDTLDMYVSTTYPDLRKCLNLLQQNTNDAKLHSATKEDVGSAEWKFDMVELFRAGKIQEARKMLCGKLRAEEMQEVFVWLYNHLDIFGAEENQDKALQIIKQGLVDHTLIIDPEINLAATLVKLSKINVG